MPRRRRYGGRNNPVREAEKNRLQAAAFSELSEDVIRQACRDAGHPDTNVNEDVHTFAEWKVHGRKVGYRQRSMRISGNASCPTIFCWHRSQTVVCTPEPAPVPVPVPDSSGESYPTPEPAPSPEPSPSASEKAAARNAERLRKLADNMQSKIERKLNPACAQQNHTARRAAMAASSIKEGYRLKGIQEARRKMADAYEDGSLPDLLHGMFSEDDIGRLCRSVRDWEKDTDEETAVRAWFANDPEAEARAAEQAREKQERELRDSVLNSPPDGYFPTPYKLARKMVELASLEPGCEVLEPSGGTGDLAEAYAEWVSRNVDDLRHALPALTIIEQNQRLCNYMKIVHGFEPINADILEVKGTVDRVIMNPPYEKKADIRHITHCYNMLNPGGVLVALASAGVDFRSDKETAEFREWAKAASTHWEKIDDAFKGAESKRQTGVSVVLMVLEKPETPCEEEE